jgi:homotetrameric cytidine deaminase
MASELPRDVGEELVFHAQKAAEQAYAPYSGIRVGAALLSEEGAIFSACNVENASYGLSICAERAAVFAAVAAEGPLMRIKALALASDDRRVTTPCGACRQVVVEFGPRSLLILPDGTRIAADKLLPGAFNLG